MIPALPQYRRRSGEPPSPSPMQQIEPAPKRRRFCFGAPKVPGSTVEPGALTIDSTVELDVDSKGSTVEVSWLNGAGTFDSTVESNALDAPTDGDSTIELTVTPEAPLEATLVARPASRLIQRLNQHHPFIGGARCRPAPTPDSTVESAATRRQPALPQPLAVPEALAIQPLNRAPPYPALRGTGRASLCRNSMPVAGRGELGPVGEGPIQPLNRTFGECAVSAITTAGRWIAAGRVHGRGVGCLICGSRHGTAGLRPSSTVESRPGGALHPTRQTVAKAGAVQRLNRNPYGGRRSRRNIDSTVEFAGVSPPTNPRRCTWIGIFAHPRRSFDSACWLAQHCRPLPRIWIPRNGPALRWASPSASLVGLAGARLAHTTST